MSTNLMGALVGGLVGHVLGQQKVGKGVVSSEMLTLGGAAAGWLATEDGLLFGKPDAPATAGTPAAPKVRQKTKREAALEQALEHQHHRHMQHLDLIDHAYNLGGADEEIEEEVYTAPPRVAAPRRAPAVPAPAPQRTAPARRVQVGAPEQYQPAEAPAPARRAAAPVRSVPLALPDFGEVEDFSAPRVRERVRSSFNRDAEDVFGE